MSSKSDYTSRAADLKPHQLLKMASKPEDSASNFNQWLLDCQLGLAGSKLVGESVILENQLTDFAPVKWVVPQTPAVVEEFKAYEARYLLVKERRDPDKPVTAKQAKRDAI